IANSNVDLGQRATDLEADVGLLHRHQVARPGDAGGDCSPADGIEVESGARVLGADEYVAIDKASEHQRDCRERCHYQPCVLQQPTLTSISFDITSRGH